MTNGTEFVARIARNEKAAHYDALAESHAELVAALTWLLDDRTRYLSALEGSRVAIVGIGKAIHRADKALAKARALVPEEEGTSARTSNR